MKLTKIFFGLLLTSSIIGFDSCSKYEDGPSVSLLSATNRVSRMWEAVKYVDANGNESDPILVNKMDIKDDGTITINSTGITYDATWAFNDDKTKFITTTTVLGISADSEVTITRLTTDEFWVRDSGGDMTKYAAK